MDSFEKLVQKHKDSIYRQMLRVCSHKEDAEDALSTAILLAFKSASSLKSEDAFRSWVGTIGTRVCGRMRSHKGIQVAWDYAKEEHLIDEKGAPFEFEMLKGCVADALSALPTVYRDVYEMCELEEKSVPEAADQLGISLSAAKSRLLRARTIVRERLDQSICYS